MAFYKSPAHRLAARSQRGDYAAASIAVHIDLRKINDLQRAMRDAGMGFRKRDQVMVQTLNRAGKRIETRLAQALQRWMGTKTQKRIREDFHPLIATRGKWRAGVRVAGRHHRITKDEYGASWRRAWAGGRHKAWNRAQTARGSFMIFGKRKDKKYKGGLLFFRPTRSRHPIYPLWGPNSAREVQRHEAFSRAIVRQQARWVLTEGTRRVDVELRRVKAKYGL